MKLLNKAARAIVRAAHSDTPRKRGRSRIPRSGRAYSGAGSNRLTADWLSINKSAGQELRAALRILRARSRELSRNDPYARKFFELVKTNVIGPKGVKLQMRVKQPDGKTDDAVANDIIERNFGEWGKLGICTMDGRLSWVDAQRLFIESVARDGEILIRKIVGKGAGNKWGFGLQFIEADHLNEDLNKKLDDGKQIIMGVEVDKFSRSLAYHLTPGHPGDGMYDRQYTKPVRIPADEFIHPFISHRVGQPRGFPWLAASMLRLQMLNGYEEAELVAARVSASKMGFFTSPDGEGYEGEGEDAEGNLVMEAEPGVFEQLPEGMEFTPFDPQHPTSQFGAFLKSLLRGVASGAGVSYNNLASDLEGVNFSSLRQGALDERDAWRTLQGWAIEHFHSCVFEGWLEWALVMGQLKLFGGTNLPFSRFEKFNAPSWTARGWQWIDPQKEGKANAEAANNLLKSKTAIVAEQGRDYPDVLQEIKAERELEKSLGLEPVELKEAPNETQGKDGND